MRSPPTRPAPAPARPVGEAQAHATWAHGALVHAETAPEAVRGVLAAWRAGLTAALVSPAADDELMRAAARQEGADPLAPQ